MDHVLDYGRNDVLNLGSVTDDEECAFLATDFYSKFDNKDRYIDTKIFLF